jgi:hypothetical protein
VKLLLLQLVTKQRAIEAKQKAHEDEQMLFMLVEILQKQQEIKDKYEPLIKQLQQEEADLAVQIKDAVVQLEATIKSEEAGAQAVYVKPSAKWNNQKLEGLMMAFPQLEQAREFGKPSVRILIDK